MSGETIRRRNLILRMQRGRGAISEPIPLNDRACYRPGILMFSRRQQLLHLNRRALELTGHFDQAEIGRACEIHSASVLDLRNAIQTALDHRRDANIFELFELKRVLLGARRRILMRGFGLADRNSHDDSSIVIVLEELDHRQERSEPLRQAMGRS